MVALQRAGFDDLIVMPTLLLKSNQEARALAEQDPLPAGRRIPGHQYQPVRTGEADRRRAGPFYRGGDDDQSIYLAGPSRRILVLLNEDFPNLRLIAGAKLPLQAAHPRAPTS